MNLPKEDWGLPVAPDTGGRGVRGGMSAGIGLGMGTKEGGFKMNLCKQRRLQCECSVVHSGKSLSHALWVDP